MATLRGDYLALRCQQHSSGVTNAVIADSTSVSVSFSADEIETTSQTDGLIYSGMAGKVKGTVSGDYLLATTGDQFTVLLAKMQAGETIEVEVWRSGSKWLSGDGFLTGLDMTGGLADSPATGSYSMTFTGTVTDADV